jgi:hypothetical protein
MLYAFMSIFRILKLSILSGIISYAADEVVGVSGAACEEVGCKMINELVDWNYLEIGMEMRDRCSPRKVSNDAQAFGLKLLEMAVIGLRGGQQVLLLEPAAVLPKNTARREQFCSASITPLFCFCTTTKNSILL